VITLLRKEKARIARLADSNAIGIFCWTVEGKIIDANEAFSDIVGYPRDVLLSKKIKWTDLTAPECHVADQLAMEELLHIGSTIPYEKEFIRRDGTHVRVLIGGAFFVKSQQSGVAFVVPLSEQRKTEQALRETEERYRAVAEAASDAIIIIDESNRIVYANPSVEAIFGYRPSDLLDQPLAMLIPDCLWRGRKEALLQNGAAGDRRSPASRLEARAIHKNGHEMQLEISIGQFRFSGNYFFTAIARDVTERKKAEALKHGQNELLEMIAMGAPIEAVFDRLIRLIESQIPRMIGSILLLSDDGVHVRHATAPNLPPGYVEAINGAAIGPNAGSCGSAIYRGESIIVTDIMKDPLWEGYRSIAAPYGLRACWSTPIFSSQGTVLGSFAMYYREPRSPQEADLRLAGVASHMASIAIERHQAEKRISHIAHHDALTGLPNRLLLHSSLTQAIANAQRHGEMMAVLFIDLDNFKRINDSLGHHVGDLLLQIAAQRLQACIRQGDILARLGGDEFVLVLSSLGQGGEAALVADKALKALDSAFEAAGHELHVGGSIGISIYPADGQDAETLMRSADTAMYHAKENGRGNYQFFTEALNVAIQHRLALENQLRQALAREEFALHYQPQIDMQSGRIVSAEALLRWHRAGKDTISPLEFIAIAEETALILPIGEWVLREACEQLRRWHGDGYRDLAIAVNLSPRQMSQSGFPDLVGKILGDSGVSAAALDLEITESMLMEPSGENMTTLRQFSEMGIQLSVDDFGTGYSSLSYLKRFPVDTLKIDQSFVRGIEHGANDMAIADAIIGMARGLHLKVIAEGVETAGQAAYLKSRGCELAQGYYYSEPLAADAFSTLLRQAAGPIDSDSLSRT
jgi:diguanylate cyclase (GGDEF)-like protein/PAS domain S-box-containing protein